MYYLLKDGRIFDDKKDYFRVDGKFINYGENCNGTFIDYEEKWIAKSENLLDLARSGDMLEIGLFYYTVYKNKNAEMCVIFFFDGRLRERNINNISASYLWKRRGNIMERHEVEK